MSGNKTREANLRALQHMLDYAMAESRRLSLPEAVKMLDGAQRIIDAALRARAAPRLKPVVPPGRVSFKLVGGRDTGYNKESEQKM